MAKVSLDIARFKSAGVYTLEYDNTETQSTETNSLRLLVGFTPKGPFNRPVYLATESDRQKIFGDIDTRLEHKGSYFNRFAQTMLSQGPIIALNLLNVDERQSGPDQVNFAAMSLAASVKNPTVASSLNPEFNYMAEADKNELGVDASSNVAVDSSVISYVGSAPYASLFDRSKFWQVSDKNLTAVAANKLDKDQDNTGVYDKSNFLNFANVGTDEFSILVLKPEGLSGYDITASEWYGGEGNIPYGWVRPNDFVSDYFLQVVCVKGNWTNYPVLAADPTWSAYFDKNGFKKNMIRQFVAAEGVELLGSWTGSIIPDFTNKQGGNMSLINRINNNTETTGLLASFNEDAAQVLSYDYDGVDNNGTPSWVYDYDFDHEANTADGETVVSAENGFTVDLVGHDFSNKTISSAAYDEPKDLEDSETYTKGDTTYTLLQPNKVKKYTYFKFTKDGDTDSTSFITSGDGVKLSKLDDVTYAEAASATEISSDLHDDIDGLLKAAEPSTPSTGDTPSEEPASDSEVKAYFSDYHHKKMFKLNTLYKIADSNELVNEKVKENASSATEVTTGVYAAAEKSEDAKDGSALVYIYIASVGNSGKLSFRKAAGSPVETDKDGYFTYSGKTYYYDGTTFKTVSLKSSNKYAIDFLSYHFVTDDKNTIRTTYSSTYYFNDASLYAADSAKPVSDANKSTFICFDDKCVGTKNTASYIDDINVRGLKVGDLVDNIAKDEKLNATKFHVIPGLARITSKVFVSVDRNSGEFTYKGKTYTLNLDADISLIENNNAYGFYLFTATDAVNITDNHTVNAQLPITDNIVSSTLRFIPMKGLKITKAHRPGYDKNGNISMEGGVEKIYSVLATEGIRRGLTNPEMIDFRYIVDSMGYGLDSELGGKKYLSKAAMDRGKCTALLNLPSAAQFATSNDPYFCDTYVSGSEVRPALNTKYIPTGGNDELYATKIFSLPSEENGAKYAAAFWPYLQYTQNGKTFNVPPAADVANVLVRKFQGNNPYMIAANMNGILNNPYLTGVEYKADTEDRDALEPFGVNTIISRNGNIMIYGNQTCFQKVKTDLNKLHVREDLNTIEIECENILHNYNFEYNTPALRASIVTALTPVLQAIQTSGAIDSYEIVCDETNNTEDIINNDYGIVDIAVVFNHGMEKIVQRLTINKYGTVLS